MSEEATTGGEATTTTRGEATTTTGRAATASRDAATTRGFAASPVSSLGRSDHALHGLQRRCRAPTDLTVFSRDERGASQALILTSMHTDPVKQILPGRRAELSLR